MRRRIALALGVIALLGALAPAALAQDYRYSAGWYVGGSFTSNVNGGSAAGALRPSASWTAGLQADGWERHGRLGLRLDGSFAPEHLGWSEGERKLLTWQAGLDLVARLLPARPDRTVAPWVALGGGFLWNGLGRGAPTVFQAADVVYPGDTPWQATVRASLGADIQSRWQWDGQPVFLRIQAADAVQPHSPFHRASDDARLDAVHSFRVSVGVHTGIGILKSQW